MGRKWNGIWDQPRDSLVSFSASVIPTKLYSASRPEREGKKVTKISDGYTILIPIPMSALMVQEL